MNKTKGSLAIKQQEEEKRIAERIKEVTRKSLKSSKRVTKGDHQRSRGKGYHEQKRSTNKSTRRKEGSKGSQRKREQELKEKD